MTIYRENSQFNNLSGTGLTFQSLSLNNAVSAINHATSTNFGYSITAFAGAGVERRYLTPTESSAANIAAFVCTLTEDLRKRGLVP